MKPSDKNECLRVVGSVDSYIDDDLARDERLAIDEHLRGCPRCRQEFSLAKSLHDELRALPALKCPGPVIDRLSDHIRASAADMATPRDDRRFVKRWFAGKRFGVPRPALAGLFVVTIVVSSLIIGRSRQPVEPITPAQVAHAEATVKWTFAYVNEVSRRSGIAVRDEVFNAGVVRPMQKVFRSAPDDETTTPQEPNGGSI